MISNSTQAFVRQTGVDGFEYAGGQGSDKTQGWSGYAFVKGDANRVVLDTGAQYKTKELAEEGVRRLVRAICAKGKKEREAVLAEFKPEEVLENYTPPVVAGAVDEWGSSVYGSAWGFD